VNRPCAVHPHPYAAVISLRSGLASSAPACSAQACLAPALGSLVPWSRPELFPFQPARSLGRPAPLGSAPGGTGGPAPLTSGPPAQVRPAEA
jgi:hypothetical protein